MDAWERFCEELKAAGRVLASDATPGDELTRAEGLRHLVRLVRDGFDMTCEFGDVAHPQLFPMADATLQTEGVTPDARYHHAFIDGAADHRLSGERGTAPFIEFSTYTGRTGLDDSHEITGSITESDLPVDSDGRYALAIGPTEQPGAWIRTDASTTRVFVRQYAHDWETTRSATFAIEREGANGRRPPITLAHVERALERTAAYVRSAPPFWAGISQYWSSHAENEIVAQEDADSRTDITVPTGHRFACGYFRLEPDEALEVRFAPADVPYWGLMLASYWYEPLSWTDRRAALNDRDAVREADGSVRVVISGQPTGAANWLDTKGHAEGTVVFRWSRTNEPIPEFQTRRIPADSLKHEPAP
jgi:hypothetical protein